MNVSSSSPGILIVDDTRTNLYILAEILTQVGYRIRPAPNGAIAIAAARAEPPELILLDIKMPGMSGYEVCEQLKADERTRKIPIIFISALDDITDKVKGFAAGGVDYITKPFQAEEVLARVRTHLTLHYLQKQLQENNAQLETELVRRERYEQELRLAASVFEHVREGIMVTDPNGIVEQVNPGLVALTGYTAEELIGRRSKVMQSGLHDQEFYRQMWATLLQTGQWQGEIWNRRKDGEAYPEWLSITANKDTQGQTQHYVAVYCDLSNAKRSEAQPKYQTYHDPLTGLPNRLLFQDRLERALAYAQRHAQHVAVLFLDLDQFKQINDTYGHKIGDLLLQGVAQRLKSCTQNVDTVARRGGDEFLIILPDTPHGSQDAIEAAQRIITTLVKPFLLEDQQIITTTSIGIALYPSDGGDVDTLVKHADLAMSQAKSQGRGRYVVFTQP